MEKGRNWGKVNPAQLESFNKLGQREQAAIKLSLTGIRQWQLTEKKPKPMHVKITPEKPFNVKTFANVLHELGVGISDSFKTEEDGSISFQPKPYSKTFLPQTDGDRVQAMMEAFKEEIASYPPEFRDMMSKYKE